MTVVIRIKIHKYVTELTSVVNQHLPVITILRFVAKDTALVLWLADVINPQRSPKFIHLHLISMQLPLGFPSL